MDVEVKNLTSSRIDTGFVKQVVAGTLRRMRIKGKISVGVVFMSAEKIQDVNREYRGEDRPTDVLSLLYNENSGSHKYLGEILVCMREVRKHAKERSTTIKRELAHVLVHATLHLLGWEHDKSKKDTERMHSKEEEIMSKFL